MSPLFAPAALGDANLPSAGNPGASAGPRAGRAKFGALDRNNAELATL